MVKEAIEEDLAEGYREMDARELRKLSQVFSGDQKSNFKYNYLIHVV